MPLLNRWYAARFLVVSTSVWLFVRSLSVFVNSVFHGSSNSSKAGRLGLSAKWSPSKRLFSMKVTSNSHPGSWLLERSHFDANMASTTQKCLGIMNFWLYVFLAVQFKFGCLPPICHHLILISNPCANQRATRILHNDLFCSALSLILIPCVQDLTCEPDASSFYEETQLPVFS